jgi:hypothetical protein
MWTEITRSKYERAGRRYASDLTDAEWRLIEPYMPSGKRLGRLHCGRSDWCNASTFRNINTNRSVDCSAGGYVGEGAHLPAFRARSGSRGKRSRSATPIVHISTGLPGKFAAAWTVTAELGVMRRAGSR